MISYKKTPIERHYETARLNLHRHALYGERKAISDDIWLRIWEQLADSQQVAEHYLNPSKL